MMDGWAADRVVSSLESTRMDIECHKERRKVDRSRFCGEIGRGGVTHLRVRRNHLARQEILSVSRVPFFRFDPVPKIRNGLQNRVPARTGEIANYEREKLEELVLHLRYQTDPRRKSEVQGGAKVPLIKSKRWLII